MGTDKPINQLSWYEAAQSVNYLNTSTGHQAAYKFTGTQGTSSYTLGVWQSGDVGYDSDNPYRNSKAFYFMPTEDEWVKAAFWNETSIQTYATKAGESLTQGDGTSGTGWNYYDGGYATKPSGSWDVGSGSEELNGTFDMMGNVWEWMESPHSSGDYLSRSVRGVRGGSYYNLGSIDLNSSIRYGDDPCFEDSGVGFRVASVPERTFVDADATGTNDGTSWGDAFNYLQDGLDAAVEGEAIWVADGAYYPTSDHGLRLGNRSKHFRLKNGVAVYGGFAGGETSLDQRDVQNNVTILSGDIGVPGDSSDNCLHVFYHPEGTDLDAIAVLDGFTITDGNANVFWPHGSGGGMHNKLSSPTVNNCIFIGNSADDNGGGMYNESSSSPVVTGCTFSGNLAGAGGGMRNQYSSPVVTNCAFNGNTANDGGGMYNYKSSPALNNCVFSGNSVDNRCGGVFNFKSDPILTNCTLCGNTAYREGGGMFNYRSSPLVTNCILWGNTALVGNEIYNYPDVARSSRPVVSYCNVGGGWEGIDNMDSDPGFVGADNLRLVPGSPCIDAGDDGMVTEIADIDGVERILDGDCDETVRVDMGAYELELDCDGSS